MARLGYTWYPNDYNESDNVFELTMAEEGVYRRLLDKLYQNNNNIQYKPKTWARRWGCDLVDLEDHLKSIIERGLVTIEGDYLFSESVLKRLMSDNVINAYKGNLIKNKGVPKEIFDGLEKIQIKQLFDHKFNKGECPDWYKEDDFLPPVTPPVTPPDLYPESEGCSLIKLNKSKLNKIKENVNKENSIDDFGEITFEENIDSLRNSDPSNFGFKGLAFRKFEELRGAYGWTNKSELDCFDKIKKIIITRIKGNSPKTRVTKEMLLAVFETGIKQSLQDDWYETKTIIFLASKFNELLDKAKHSSKKQKSNNR